MAWKQEREALLAKICQLETENEDLRKLLDAKEHAPTVQAATEAAPQQPMALPQQMAAVLSQLTGVLGQVSAVLGQYAAGSLSVAAPAATEAVAPLPKQDIPGSEESQSEKTTSPSEAGSAPEEPIGEPEESVSVPDQMIEQPDTTASQTVEAETASAIPADAPAEETAEPVDAIAAAAEAVFEPQPEEAAVSPVEAVAEPEAPAAGPEQAAEPTEAPALEPDQPEEDIVTPVEAVAEPEAPAAEPEQAEKPVETPAAEPDQPEEAVVTPVEAVAEPEANAAEPEQAAGPTEEPALEPDQPEEVIVSPVEAVTKPETPAAEPEQAVEPAETPAAEPDQPEEAVASPVEAVAEPEAPATELEQPIAEPVQAEEAPEEIPVPSAEAVSDSEDTVPSSEESTSPSEAVSADTAEALDAPAEAAAAQDADPASPEEPAAPEQEAAEILYKVLPFQHFSPYEEVPEGLSETADGTFSLFQDTQDETEAPSEETAADVQDAPEPEAEAAVPAENDPENPLTLGTRIPDPDLRMVTADSPTAQKLDLFWTFFCPREEVYALRWEDKKNEKAGYNFKCRNIFDPMVCPKSWAYQGKHKPPVSEKGKSNPCIGCPGREYVPLTREAVMNHLRKNASPTDVIGMYSILPGDMCRFLVLDFDEGDWQDCVRTIREICSEWTIPCAVERSRSGNGAHIWIFFSENVLARDARKLGSFLITEAAKRSKAMKLTSYDRMFPAQDSMPAGGLGSLIALPFQGGAAKGSDPLQFNSVFVDENFQTISDQWAYLAGLYRLSNADLLAHLQLHQHESATGVLVQNQDGDEGQPFPRFRKFEEKITAKDFHGRATVVRSNMLYIPLNGITPRARDRLMRLATFSNKDFYKQQAMHRLIWGIPRLITAAEDRGNYLAIPRGCEKAMVDLFQERNIPYAIEDRTTTGTPIDVSFVGKLWPDQQPAADAILKGNLGVLSATTAFGKTVVGAWVIAERKVNTLVLVDRESLMQQWAERLEQFLLLPEPVPAVDPNAKPKRGRKPKAVTDPSPIGQIGGGVNRPTGVVDVATFQSLWDKKTGQVNPIIRNYGMVIVDECHHVAADVFQQVAKEADARYLLGLSATPNRQDGKGPLVRFILGPVRYRVDAMEQAEKDGLTRVLIPRFTNFREPFNLDHPWEFNDACTAMIDDEERNARIVQDVRDALAQGRSPLVLTQRVEHAKKLESLMTDLPAQVITLTGKDSSRERQAKQQALLHLQPEEPLVLIATGQYAGEGFDLARLDTLMMVMPVSSKDLVAQFVGRLHRAYRAKSTVYVYDYVDHQNTMLLRMYQKRLRAYAENGYSVRSNSTVPPEGNRLFTEKDYRNTFQDDLSQAKSQVVLSGRLLTQTKVQDFLKRLRPGVSAEIFLPATQDLSAEEETSLAASLDLLHIRDIPVHRIPGCCQEFAVLDQKLLWYGGLDLLGKPDADCGCMRLQSPELSADLLHIADEWRKLAADDQLRLFV